MSIYRLDKGFSKYLFLTGDKDSVGEEVMFWGVPLMDNSISVDIFPAEFISMHVYFPQSIAEISLTSRIESSPLITCGKAIR